MKLETRPDSLNYQATVVQVHGIRDIGMNTLNAVNFFGFQALVGKDVQEGDIGIFFGAETQLSHEFASANNLYREKTLNADPDGKPGFFELNRRVKAIKLGGQVSNGFFVSRDSLLPLLPYALLDDLRVGDSFNSIDGIEICRKYFVKQPQAQAERTEKNRQKIVSRVDARFFPLHIDTENWWKNEYKIAEDEHLVVTQKLHGTSVRIGHTIVNRPLTWLDKLAIRFGIKVQSTEYAHVYGSRKVTKDPNNPNQNHYYAVEAGDADIWTSTGAKLDGAIPQGYVVYGEIIGWTKGGGAIQSGYTYALPQGESELYVYRVVTVSPEGAIEDLSWAAVKGFCEERGIKYVPELWDGPKYDFDVDQWIDKAFYKMPAFHRPVVALSDPKSVDEGVVIRAEGRNPFFTKAKSPKFFEYESKQLDAGTVDLESEESVV